MPTITENTQYISTYHLQRLFLFRNSLIVAELLLLALAARLWSEAFPYLQILLVTMVYMVFNLWTWFRRPRNQAVPPSLFLFHLCVDVLALSWLLYLTGGANNPFVSLLLLPLLLGAAILPKRHIYAVATMTLLAYTALMLLPHTEQAHPHVAMQQHASSLNAHAIGMAISFLFSVAVILFFVVTMAEALRDRERKLADAHEKTLRNEHVIALGTLAAGAAHELGTPLGTMAVLTREMEYEYADNPDLLKQIQVLRTQIERCKTAISQMSSSAGQLRAINGRSVNLLSYMKQLATSWQKKHPDIKLEIQHISKHAPQLVLDDTFSQALLNLINNAMEAGATQIIIRLHWSSHHLAIKIMDNGSGLPQNIQDSIGKPFVSGKASGQGIGFYLAQAVINRMGGGMSIENLAQHKGACVTIGLPLQNLQTQGNKHD